MNRFVPVALSLLLSAHVAAAEVPPGSAQPPGSSSQWPLLPGPDTVVHGFDPPAKPWLAGHRGVDLAGRSGQRVGSATTGVVTFAGRVAGVGVVSVTDGPLRTTYEPVHISVHVGQRVVAGEVLGRLSSAGSHCAPAPCLHWGLLRDGEYLDPLALLGLEQVVLLPLDESLSPWAR